MKKISTVLLALICAVSFSAQADMVTAAQAAKDYGSFAKRLNPKSTLSADAGRAFYTKKVTANGKTFACSDCHKDNPALMGEHYTLGDPIKPLAPSANPSRFSDLNKSEKNFTKHCKDLYNRNCTPQEKGDFVTYLLTVK